MFTATAHFSCSDFSDLLHEIDKIFYAKDEKGLLELIEKYAKKLNNAGWKILKCEWEVGKINIQET